MSFRFGSSRSQQMANKALVSGRMLSLKEGNHGDVEHVTSLIWP